MEMMVVLLIVSIIAAATAPMVTKKMARSAGSGDSPWVFTGLNNNISYNMGGTNASAIIGSANYSYGDDQPKYPRLVLAAGDSDHPALVFAKSSGAFGGQINMDADNNIVTMNDRTVGNNSVALGMGQNSSIALPTNIVAIGAGANINGIRSVAIGFESTAAANSVAIGSRMNRNVNNQMDRTNATGSGAIAIGQGARAEGARTIAIGTSTFKNNQYHSPFARDEGAIAIGPAAQAFGTHSIAIGASNGSTSTSPHTQAYGNHSVAIGPGARTKNNYSVAIGSSAETTAENQIVLGTSIDTVFIPGNLIVGRNTLLGSEGRGFRTFISHKTDGKDNWHIQSIEVNSGSDDDYRWGEEYSEGRLESSYYSDRRLKNVGEKYTAGLEELKKLDFYHFTFKADKDNTPLVGVMAQDLQKVFPDAVTKGDDGYLRIRLEDMFYAVINAVKELDTKISEFVTAFNSKLDSQNQRIESLEKQNSELLKQNAELQEEIKNIEKRIKKLEK